MHLRSLWKVVPKFIIIYLKYCWHNHKNIFTALFTARGGLFTFRKKIWPNMQSSGSSTPASQRGIKGRPTPRGRESAILTKYIYFNFRVHFSYLLNTPKPARVCTDWTHTRTHLLFHFSMERFSTLLAEEKVGCPPPKPSNFALVLKRSVLYGIPFCFALACPVVCCSFYVATCCKHNILPPHRYCVCGALSPFGVILVGLLTKSLKRTVDFWIV